MSLLMSDCRALVRGAHRNSHPTKPEPPGPTSLSVHRRNLRVEAFLRQPGAVITRCDWRAQGVRSELGTNRQHGTVSEVSSEIGPATGSANPAAKGANIVGSPPISPPICVFPAHPFPRQSGSALNADGGPEPGGRTVRRPDGRQQATPDRSVRPGAPAPRTARPAPSARHAIRSRRSGRAPSPR